MIRRQLPAYSPLTAGSLFRALRGFGPEGKNNRQKLEDELTHRFSARSAVLTGSGTQALELAIRWALPSAHRRGPVALPAFTCYDVASAAVGADADVLFYDVDPETLSPDMDSFRDALSRGARVAVVNNLYGFPVNWTLLRESCRAAGIAVIEDVAQGIGSGWLGRPGGTFGDLTVLSFGRGKGWTGGGGGGILIHGDLSDSDGGAAGLPEPPPGDGMRRYLPSVAQFLLGRPSLFGIPRSLPGLGLGETHYKEPVTPTRINPVSAALVLETGGEVSPEIETRRGNAARIATLLADAGDRLEPMQPLDGGTSSFLRFPLLLRKDLRGLPDTPAAAALGMERGYPMHLPALPQLAGRVSAPAGEFPGAMILADRLATLPTHSLLSDRDFDRLRSFLTGR